MYVVIKQYCIEIMARQIDSLVGEMVNIIFILIINSHLLLQSTKENQERVISE